MKADVLPFKRKTPPLPTMTEPTCDGCRYYNRIEDKPEGACRRFPPKMMAVASGYQTSFAIVGASMWCGEHKPRRK